MNEKFLDYEQHLEIFLDAGGDAHARHMYGEPIKPEGYDEWKKMQAELKASEEVNAPIGEIKTKKVVESVEVKGYEFDEDGIPKYLTADDVYMGNINPEWEKKHNQPEKKEIPANLNKNNEPSTWGLNLDEDGIPQYLTIHDRHEGNVNPEWAAKHQKNE